MHIWTRLKESARGKTGYGIYPDGMVEHDAHVGRILDKLKELGLEGNTIVMYSTDNGAEKFTWPDGDTSPFRGERRIPTGKAATVCRRPFAGPASSSPALCSMTSSPTKHAPYAVGRCRHARREGAAQEGMKVGDKTFKVHLDGYNITDALAGKTPSPRHEFFYFNDDGQLIGLRYDQWKLVFAEQTAHGAAVWRNPFTTLRAPKIFNLRSDPFEIGDQEGMDWNRWWVEHIFLLVPAASIRRAIHRHVQGISAKPEGR